LTFSTNLWKCKIAKRTTRLKNDDNDEVDKVFDAIVFNNDVDIFDVVDVVDVSDVNMPYELWGHNTFNVEEKKNVDKFFDATYI
jgi:hypothetical protein